MLQPDHPDYEPPYGWVMVATVFLLAALSFGLTNAMGVFLKPLSAEFGWSRGETSFGYTMAAVAVAGGGLFWGIVADRFGTTVLAVMGVLMMATALTGLSHVQELWQFYLLYLMFGFFGHSPLGGPLFANVGFWFKRNKGLALGIMSAGSMAGAAMVPLLSRYLISPFGWRDTFLILAGIYVVVGLPLALMVRESPVRKAARGAKPTQDPPGESPLSPVETMAWICAATLFCCICMSVAVVHLVPLVSDRGVAPETAAGVLAGVMVAGVAGRIGAGKLSDRIGALRAYTLNSVMQTALIFWFPHVVGLPATYVLAVVFGYFYAGVMASIMIVVRVMMPARMGARAMGAMGLTAWTGMGLGGWLGGALHDVSGAYVLSFATASLAGLVNLSILNLFRYRLNNPPPRAIVKPA